MDIKRDFRYYVVEFSNPPYCDIDQYVCIPDSWIQLRQIVDQVIVTKFPVENLSITKKRVKDGEVFSDAWSIYAAEVKYGTDSYEDAEKYIKTLTEKLINKQSCSGPVNNDDGVSKILKSLRRSKRIQSNLSVNKPQVSEAPSSYNIEPVSEQLAAISTKIATHKKHTNGVATINSDNEVIKQTDPGQIKNVSDFYFEEGLLFLDHTNDELVQHCTYLEKLMDGINNLYYSGSYNPLNTTIKDTVAPVVEEIEREEKEIEKKRQVLKRTQAEIGIIKRRETERNEQEIDDSADNDDEDDDNNDDDDDDDDGNDDDDDDDDYVKRKRFQSRTLTLPPEYDKNDSKWTLRYREYAPGLVELIEHTGVYINAVKLVNCKRLAKNSKTLARLLLVEIFTESALYTCSLTGVRAKAFDIDGTHVRPGLDENARTVLLTYVEQYAQASKWPKTANQSILNSIRNKMQEIRFKCNK